MPSTPATAPAPHPPSYDSANFPSPAAALARYRELTVDVCDVTPLCEIEDLRVRTYALHFGNAVMLENQETPMRFDRTAGHIARGLDHFQLTTYFAGGVKFETADRTVWQRLGDVALIDMTQPSVAREIAGDDGVIHGIGFMLPRPMVLPLLPDASRGPAAAIVSRESGHGRILREHMLALWRHARELNLAEGRAAIQSLVHLSIGGLGASAEEPVNPSQDALRLRVKRHIEENLGAASLGVESLCRTFALSRASLYRLFAPQSPAAYIQQRRLHRAFAMLVAPAFRPWRIGDIAAATQFSSDTTFIRAFRRQFGLTPGEARELGPRALASPAHGPAHPQPDQVAIDWVGALTDAAAQI